MQCVLCEIVDPMEKFSEQYAYQLFVLLGKHATYIFESFIGLWFIYQIIYKGFIKAEINFASSFNKLLVYCIILAFLRNSELFWSWIYTPLNSTVNELLLSIIKVTQNSNNALSSKARMIEVVDATSGQIFELSKMFFSGGYFDISRKIAGAPIVFIYACLFAMFVGYYVDYLFKLLLMTAISPLLLVCFAFPSTKAHCINGLKVVLHGMLNLIFSVIAMSLTLVVAKELFSKLPISGGVIKENASSWIYSKDYWACLMLAIVSIIFQKKISEISSTILNVSMKQFSSKTTINDISPPNQKEDQKWDFTK